MRHILLLLAFLPLHTLASNLSDYLLPAPKHLVINNGKLLATDGVVRTNNYSKSYTKPLLLILNAFEQTEINAHAQTFSPSYKTPLLSYNIDKNKYTDQAYELTINKHEISIYAGSETGVYYALLSLKQVGDYAKTTGHWPCIHIKDEPDFEKRGLMIDISRDKVPTMNTLYSLVDKLALWKINEVQLYTEHTFAYKNHQTVWQNASPITAEEIQALDAYCQRHHIDLVPNQNSFGHMKRWLIHDEYKHLAELPKPGKTIWGMRSLTSLSPVEEGSLELMKELYAELLPNFSSSYFNIGCDETVELGVGKSKALCDSIGKGRVYLDYVLKLKKEVDKYGKQTQFWGDIILHHPELIPELPKDMTALIWGYDANYPFDKYCMKFKKAGLPYYVCPGTSTWNTIIGRNENGFANLKNAAVHGKKHGAKGYLNTNWGDQGHWQPLSICYPAILYGAALSWNVDENKNIDLATHTSQQIFNDKTKESGKAVVNLGNAYLKMNAITDNSNIFHQLLKRNKYSIKTDRWLKSTNIESTKTTIEYIKQQRELLMNSSMECADKNIILEEINQASKLAIHSCNLALAKLNTNDGNFKSINEEYKTKLRAELKSLIEEHKRIWLLRNRVGGLNDSANKMQSVLNTY